MGMPWQPIAHTTCIYYIYFFDLLKYVQLLTYFHDLSPPYIALMINCISTLSGLAAVLIQAVTMDQFCLMVCTNYSVAIASYLINPLCEACKSLKVSS